MNLLQEIIPVVFECVIHCNNMHLVFGQDMSFWSGYVTVAILATTPKEHV